MRKKYWFSFYREDCTPIVQATSLERAIHAAENLYLFKVHDEMPILQWSNVDADQARKDAINRGKPFMWAFINNTQKAIRRKRWYEKKK